MKTPEIIFSEWHPWNEIKAIPNGNRKGIYIIGRWEQKPDGAARPDAKEVLYIGETHGQSRTIYKRLQTFFKAARIGQMIHKHSGGNRFNRVLAGDLTNVYAAGFGPQLEDERFLTPYIYYVERKLIWEYIARWGCMPQCNGK